MDRINEIAEKCRKILRTASLRKAMALYLVMAVFITLIAMGITYAICENWKDIIRQVNGVDADYSYVGDGNFVISFEASGERATVVRGEDMATLSPKDTRLWGVLSAIEILCIPIYSVGAIILVSVIYYRNKLREPIALLKTEMDCIKKNDLSFCCFYDSGDEMGDICQSMDGMRQAVISNQQAVWELMEEQRILNAAFAHDLRTPLTVINGYVEMLLEYYPKGQVSEEQLLNMLTLIQGQTDWMRIFSETMKEVHGFETLEIEKKKHTEQELEREIRNIVTGLERDNAPDIRISMKPGDSELYYDENVVMEVLGNLLSNALRYGKKKIEILAEKQGEKLFLYVRDDGRGMTKEELYKADSPYYSDKTKNGEKQSGGDDSDRQNVHFGLGLTICKILCKKHGGSLSFCNSVDGGAIVCAEFFVG